MTTLSSSTAAPQAPASPITPSRFYVAMGMLVLVEVLGALESSMLASAMPTINRQFHDLAMVAWLATAFSLAVASTAAIGGRLGDIFGRRRMLIVVVGVCGIGSLVSATAGNLEMIIVGRAIQGASGAILPLSYGMVRELAPPGKAPTWIGLLTGAYGFAAAIGYILGGYFADIGSWTWMFWLTGGLSLLSIPLLLLLAPPTKPAAIPGKIDVVGAVLFAPAVAAILFGVTKAGAWGWGSTTTWAFIGGGAALLGLWAWYEAHRDDPLIDVRLLARREILLGNSCGALVTMGMMQLPFVILMFMQQPKLAGAGLGVSATMAGILKLPSNIVSVIAAPLGGWISGASGARWAVVLGALSGVIAWTSLIFFHSSLAAVVALAILCSFGSNVLLGSLPNMVLEGTPMERSSEVTGMLSVVRGVFAAVGVQTLMILLSSSSIVDPVRGVSLPSERAYQLTFGAIAVAAALAALLAVLGGKTRYKAV